MRKGLFALVLVAASFAGGAAINGPGLAWARGLLEKPGGLKVAAVPPASVPPEGLDDPSGMSRIRPGSDSEIPESSRSPIGLDAPALGPAPLASPASKAPSAPDSLVPPDLGPPDVGRDAEPSSREAPAVVPAPPVPKPELLAKADRSLVRAGAPASSSNKDWAGLRRRMHALGVTRYWVEGEPGGPCTFRCVIPTAGGQAVGQHFEAEGDDDFQAAEAALRRVALWKATESP